MRRLLLCVSAFLFLATMICSSQQTDIRQFTLISGYSYLHTPSLNLAQRGYNFDFAQNVRPWLSIGFDFSGFTGGSTLLPSYLNAETLGKLAQILPPGIPPSAVTVPYTSSTYTYQVGPQLNYRRFKHVTLFVRPALGLLHAKIQTHPNPVATPIVGALLGGKLSTADNAVFYGFGGGATWEIHPNFGLRIAADTAWFNFFPDVLNGTRGTVRLTVATKFSFGKKIRVGY
ncbi:MAG TPA: hypothetical protein VK466_04105 [Terriglobales bacterium]|nr:hypothetical protein [Terriglobales bacterium]